MKIQYKTVRATYSLIEEILNKYAKEDWILVQILQFIDDAEVIIVMEKN